MDYMEISIYMIKRGAIILTGVAILLLSGCTIDWKKGAEYAIDSAKEMHEKQEKKEQTDSHDTSGDDEYIYISEEEVAQEAERVVNIVMDALEEKDAEAIKNLFSDYTCKEYIDIDKQIEEAFNFIDGDIISTGHVLAGYSGGSTSAQRGDIKTLYSGTVYEIVTNKGISYTLLVQGIYNFNMHEEKEGVYSICILNDKERSKSSNYGNDVGKYRIGNKDFNK